MSDAWKAENELNVATYDRLVKEYGLSYRAADWGSQQSQQLRFRILFECGIGAADSVLDIGCGLGDFYAWLAERRPDVDYSGIDITPTMIEAARQRFPGINFDLADVYVQPDTTRSFDYVVASGIFAKRPTGGQVYLETAVARMFSLCRKGAAFNSLASWTEDKEEGEFYADPIETLQFCRTLTPRVVLRTDYHPRDFTIYLYKN